MKMANLREWGELHGEMPMSRKQFDEIEAAERAYRRQYFTLRLTPDELDWLLGQVLPAWAAHCRGRGAPGEALDIDAAIKDWTAEAMDQGYRNPARPTVG